MYVGVEVSWYVYPVLCTSTVVVALPVGVTVAWREPPAASGMEILDAPAGRSKDLEFEGEVERVTVPGVVRRATAQRVSEVC